MNDIGSPNTPYLSLYELATYLRISIHTARKWRKKGRVPPPYKPAGKLLWRKDEIDHWVEKARKPVLDEATIRTRIGLVSVPGRF